MPAEDSKIKNKKHIISLPEKKKILATLISVGQKLSFQNTLMGIMSEPLGKGRLKKEKGKGSKN